MIGYRYFEMRFGLLAVFPEQCLKATPDPEFLSNLYGFNMSLCPHKPERTFDIARFFKERFDAIHSTSRVPELLVWMQSQVRSTFVVLFIHNDFHCIETP